MTLRLASSWVGKNRLGARVSTEDETLHAGRISRFDPDSLDGFLAEVSKASEEKGLAGVNGEVLEIRKNLERKLNDGPRGRVQGDSGSGGQGGSGPGGPSGDPRPRIRFLSQNLHRATEQTDSHLCGLDPLPLYQRGTVVVQIVAQRFVDRSTK